MRSVPEVHAFSGERPESSHIFYGNRRYAEGGAQIGI